MNCRPVKCADSYGDRRSKISLIFNAPKPFNSVGRINRPEWKEWNKRAKQTNQAYTHKVKFNFVYLHLSDMVFIIITKWKEFNDSAETEYIITDTHKKSGRGYSSFIGTYHISHSTFQYIIFNYPSLHSYTHMLCSMDWVWLNWIGWVWIWSFHCLVQAFIQIVAAHFS